MMLIHITINYIDNNKENYAYILNMPVSKCQYSVPVKCAT